MQSNGLPIFGPELSLRGIIASGEGSAEHYGRTTLRWLEIDRDSDVSCDCESDDDTYLDHGLDIDMFLLDDAQVHDVGSRSSQPTRQKRSVTFSDSGEVVLFEKDSRYEQKNAEIIQKKKGIVSQLLRKIGRGRRVEYEGRNVRQLHQWHGDSADGEQAPKRIHSPNFVVVDTLFVPTKGSECAIID